jgi:hypothetical protein
VKIAKPMLLVATPIGVAVGIYEGFRLAGGLVVLMIALLSLIGVAMATVVATVRREQRAERAAALARDGSPGPEARGSAGPSQNSAGP